MLKYLKILAVIMFCSFVGYGQSQTMPCVTLTLSADTDKIGLDSLWNYTLLYTITNCSNEPLRIDTFDIPNYEDREYGRINFRIFARSEQSCFCRYPAMPNDVQQLIDFENNHSIHLKPGQTYTYSIQLFKFYSLREKGDYTIYASYQIPLKNDSGYYLKHAENYLYLTIE